MAAGVVSWGLRRYNVWRFSRKSGVIAAYFCPDVLVRRVDALAFSARLPGHRSSVRRSVAAIWQQIADLRATHHQLPAPGQGRSDRGNGRAGFDRMAARNVAVRLAGGAG